MQVTAGAAGNGLVIFAPKVFFFASKNRGQQVAAAPAVAPGNPAARLDDSEPPLLRSAAGLDESLERLRPRD